MSRTLVRDEDRGHEKSHWNGVQPYVERRRPIVHVATPDGGHQPEEHEHEQLSETPIAVGDWPADVGEGRDDAGSADGDDYPAGDDGQIQSGQ